MWFLTAGVAGLFFVGHRNLIRSPMGRALMMGRRSEPVASSLRISPARFKLAAFTIYAALSGVAGSFYQMLNGPISSETFDVGVSITVLLMVVLGGEASVAGPASRCPGADHHPAHPQSDRVPRRGGPRCDLRRHPAGRRARRAGRPGRARDPADGPAAPPPVLAERGHRPPRIRHGSAGRRRRPGQRGGQGGRAGRAGDPVGLPIDRWSADPGRCVLHGGGRHHPRPDRTQRLRQDDAVELRERTEQAQRRVDDAVGRASVGCGQPPRQGRRGQDVPDGPAVRNRLGPRQPARRRRRPPSDELRLLRPPPAAGPRRGPPEPAGGEPAGPRPSA